MSTPHGAFPFMDVDEYRRKYPERSMPTYQEEPLPEVDVPFDTTKSPAMIVEEYSVKSYKQIGTAFFNELEDYNANTGLKTYTCDAKMMKFTGTGRARTKKNAKQMACYELLKCAVNMDRYKDFHIPAKTKEEALKLLEQIKPEEDVSDSQAVAPVANYVGKLMDFCLQNKLSTPIYECSDSGPDNNKIFTVHAILGTSKGSSSGRKKKEAKTAAAQELLKILESQVANLKKATDQVEGKGADMGEDVDEEPIEGLLGAVGVNVSRAHTDPEPQKALKGILDDTTRFLPDYVMQYRELEHPSTRGRTQTLLTIKYSKAPPQPVVHPDGTVTTPKVDKDAPPLYTYIFPGEGQDVDSGRDAAARSALVHFLTYESPSSRPSSVQSRRSN